MAELAGYQTADATGAPTGPRQDLAERGRAAEEVVNGGVSTGAGNDKAGRHRNPARIIEEYYEQVLATLQGRRDRLARTLLDRETHTSPRRTARRRPSRPELHHAYRRR